MRKITKDAIAKFYSFQSFKRGNTEVIPDGGAVSLMLHGHEIACLWVSGTLTINTHGWLTNVTKERLNGLEGVNITQKAFNWYLNGKPWNGFQTNVKEWDK